MGDDMPTWNAHQYLKFADERTRPCKDLVSRIGIAAPRRIVDLGFPFRRLFVIAYA
jgi:trans-aconitate 2-methyltransferase